LINRFSGGIASTVTAVGAIMLVIAVVLWLPKYYLQKNKAKTFAIRES